MADEVEGPRCVEVRKSAPYRGYGHHHIVTVRNTCEEDVRCRVSTDVTPETQSLNVAAGEDRLALFRLRSHRRLRDPLARGPQNSKVAGRFQARADTLAVR